MIKQSLLEWYKEGVEKSTDIVSYCDINHIPAAAESERWVNTSGKIKRGDNKFFWIEGLIVHSQSGDIKYGQPIIHQVSDKQDPKKRAGYVILLIGKKTGKILVQRCFEPGQSGPGHISLKATIQTSYSNLILSKVPFSEFLDLNSFREGHDNYKAVICANDPNRIIGDDYFGFIEVDESDPLDNPDFRWCSLQEILSALKDGVPCNIHFLAALGNYLLFFREGGG